jgi:hypothetical protein
MSRHFVEIPLLFVLSLVTIESLAQFERAEPPAFTAPFDAAPLTSLPPTFEVGQAVSFWGYIWMFRPECPSCPEGAECEACPPPYYQFSSNPHLGFATDPGRVVLVDIPGDPYIFRDDASYVVQGTVADDYDMVYIVASQVWLIPTE